MYIYNINHKILLWKNINVCQGLVTVIMDNIFCRKRQRNTFIKTEKNDLNTLTKIAKYGCMTNEVKMYLW